MKSQDLCKKELDENKNAISAEEQQQNACSSIHSLLYSQTHDQVLSGKAEFCLQQVWVARLIQAFGKYLFKVYREPTLGEAVGKSRDPINTAPFSWSLQSSAGDG